MFMVRGSDNRLEEMGRVYVYLQRGPLDLELLPSHLTGNQVYGRYGSTIAPLGDLDQDGFSGKTAQLIANDAKVGVLELCLSTYQSVLGESLKPELLPVGLAAPCTAVAAHWCVSECVGVSQL